MSLWFHLQTKEIIKQHYLETLRILNYLPSKKSDSEQINTDQNGMRREPLRHNDFKMCYDVG